MVGSMRRWLVRVVLVYAVASLLAGTLLGEFALRRGQHSRTDDARARAGAVAAAHGARLVDVRLPAADGAALAGWLFTTGRPARGTVLVAHGVGGWRAHATAYAEFLLDAGFDVLAPDARGHGESQGIATYGILEADDVRRWAAWARARSGGGCVYALGASMGGAHVLQAEAAGPTFCAVVTDGAFATFFEAGLDRIARRLPFGDAGRWVGRPAAWAGLGYVRLAYGVNLLAANPVDGIGRIRAPLLLIHGDADRNTPPYHAAALARAAPRATLWLIPGASHTGTWGAAPQEFPRRIVAFFAAGR
jgi:uncharacterized protein